MKMYMTKEQFQSCVIAQDDDNDYSENGYVAAIVGGVAYLAYYGHCSCYGTFEAVCGGGVSDCYEAGDVAWQWNGTPDELVAIARAKVDYTFPTRPVNPEDSDADHLLAVYEQIVKWDEAGRPLKQEHP